MIFPKSMQRAFAYLKTQRAARNAEDIPEEGVPLEKGDLKAMIISAMLVFMPVAIGIMILMLLFMALFFWR